MMMSEFKKFGELEVGDMLVGSDGKPTTITDVYDVHIPESMYRLEFDTGDVIEASGNHLWYVETSLDRALHRTRVKSARKLLKNILDKEKECDLLKVAELQQPAETTLADMVAIIGHENDAIVHLCTRVAESIGHIAEETTTHVDMLTNEPAHQVSINVYDARLFCQQILALAYRKYARKWPVVVGQVLTTEALTNLSMDVNFPDVKPLKRP